MWRVYFGNSQDTRTFVAIDTWELEIKPQPAPEPTPATPLPEGFQSARDAILLVQHWMPSFVARQGTVIFDDQTVLLPRIALENCSKVQLPIPVSSEVRFAANEIPQGPTAAVL